MVALFIQDRFVQPIYKMCHPVLLSLPGIVVHLCDVLCHKVRFSS